MIGSSVPGLAIPGLAVPGMLGASPPQAASAQVTGHGSILLDAETLRLGHALLTGSGHVIVIGEAFIDDQPVRVVLGTLSPEGDSVLASALEQIGATAILIRLDKRVSGSLRRLN